MKTGDLRRALPYVFHDQALLIQALTHSSYANDMGGSAADGNERLEFLGDAVLDAIISDRLYEGLGQSDEGELTRRRARIVNEKSLGDAGLKAGIHLFVRLGKGEELSGGRQRISLVADAVEAIIGAVFKDGGWEAARGIVDHFLGQTLARVLAGEGEPDSKSDLQEILQREAGREPVYRTLKEEGPAHARHFTVGVYVGEVLLGLGEGSSKKEAEQQAAAVALREREGESFHGI